jgi:uncharacterized protein YkwD
MHGVPELRLSESLSQAALAKATSADESGMIATSEPGMNVFEICEGAMSGAAVTKQW